MGDFGTGDLGRGKEERSTGSTEGGWWNPHYWNGSTSHRIWRSKWVLIERFHFIVCFQRSSSSLAPLLVVISGLCVLVFCVCVCQVPLFLYLHPYHFLFFSLIVFGYPPLHLLVVLQDLVLVLCGGEEKEKFIIKFPLYLKWRVPDGSFSRCRQNDSDVDLPIAISRHQIGFCSEESGARRVFRFPANMKFGMWSKGMCQGGWHRTSRKMTKLLYIECRKDVNGGIDCENRGCENRGTLTREEGRETISQGCRSFRDNME